MGFIYLEKTMVNFSHELRSRHYILYDYLHNAGLIFYRNIIFFRTKDLRKLRIFSFVACTHSKIDFNLKRASSCQHHWVEIDEERN
jgi:hypothetical protein